MTTALRRRWPEYLMEAWGLGTFMLSACLVTALVEHPAHRVLADPIARRALVGVAMGVTAIGIVYSPWGKQSGAHLNPSMTLAFLRLGRIAPWDACFYVVAQFGGAALGVALSAAILGAAIGDPAVAYAVTVRGDAGVAIAFAAEVAISFGMMTLVLASTSSRFARMTGVFCGLAVAAYVACEAPRSGMSMNPARTFGSAVVAQVWTAFWIYCVAPPAGMVLAVESFVRRRRGVAPPCAKLHHANARRCIHCGDRPADGSYSG